MTRVSPSVPGLHQPARQWSRPTTKGDTVDPHYNTEAEAYRETIKAFLAAKLPDGWTGMGHFDPEERRAFIAEWRQTLFENNLLAVAWPTEYGGAGLSLVERTIIAEEFAKAGVPQGNDNDGFSIGMIGHTLIEWGTDEQKKEFLPKIINGEQIWCQGYSEPNSGSDLASLATKAELDGDEWSINGQKIWTSQGHSANWIFVLCRTDPDVRKQAGISFLLCPMDQPGVDVRPIVNASGHHDFNEVFFTDARTHKDNVVGEVHNGWAVANTLLGYERGDGATVAGIRYGEELDRLRAVAKAKGRNEDPSIRQRLAWCYSQVEVMRYQGLRMITDAVRGYQQGPESSLAKLISSEYHQVVTILALDIIGAEATAPSGRDSATGVGFDDVGSPYSSQSWVTAFIGARPGSIYSGSNEIQRNIVGERVLGLPREPRNDEGPWKDLVRS
ncbi:MAG: acyl-CoA dehydrogenase [Actinomycetia bacterium]|nr:acyl-CoA dehydrogenase [Actinomycetes bacterium]